MQLKEYEKLRKSMDDGNIKWSIIASQAEKLMKEYEQDEIPYYLYTRRNQNILSNLGIYGMGVESGPLSARKTMQLRDGEFEEEYMGGKVKKYIEDPEGKLNTAVDIITAIQVMTSVSVGPTEAGKVAGEMYKQLTKLGKTKSQVEAKRKEDIKEQIRERRPDVNSAKHDQFYKTLEFHSKKEYQKRLIDLSKDEFKAVEQLGRYY